MRQIIEVRRKRDVVAVVLGTTLLAVVISVGLSIGAISKLPPEHQAGSLTVAIVAPVVCTLICASPLVTLMYRVTLMRDELARVAVTDMLTGVNNRRGFFEKASALLADGAQRKYDVFVIDLDFFKRINDGHGHGVGDKVLAAVGGALAGLFGESEVVGRTGGEEFAVLAQWDPQRTTAATGEAIRLAIKALQIQVEGEKLSITASIGYAPVGSPAELDAALVRADTALYRAKKRGRNWVEAALLAA